MRAIARLTAAALLATTVPPAWAGSCPAVLEAAMRIALVVSPDMDRAAARLAMFERDAITRRWRRVAADQPAVVGLKGLAWGQGYAGYAAPNEPTKVEGDKRTPAGIYPLGATFGFDPASYPDHIALVAGTHVCIDDLGSPHYGKIVPRSVAGPATSGEEMRSIPLYRRGIIVDYPTDRFARSGSCIFVHVWRSARHGTTGCVGLPEETVARLQGWRAPGGTVLAVLPETALGRFAGCLPDSR